MSPQLKEAFERYQKQRQALDAALLESQHCSALAFKRGRENIELQFRLE